MTMGVVDHVKEYKCCVMKTDQIALGILQLLCHVVTADLEKEVCLSSLIQNKVLH